MSLKNTRQRQMILQLVMESKEHLTAEQVYLRLQENNEKIGLATVYRNLNMLYQTHQINRVLHQESGYVYDGNTHPHYHMVCESCGKVLDIELPYQEQIDELAKTMCEEEIHSHSVVFNGICKDCLDKKRGKN